MIARLRPQLAKVQGVNLFLQPSQDITVGGKISRGQFQYTLQDANLDELNTWAPRMLAKLKTLPGLADVSTDQQGNAPQLQVTINRDAAARFGIQPQAIDDTLDDAFGQRQVGQYYTQTNSYFIVLEALPDLQKNTAGLDNIYVKAPSSGQLVPLSTLVEIDTDHTGSLSVSHQGQFPAVTLSFNLQPGVALGQAVDAIQTAAAEIGKPASVIGTFQGNAQAFQSSLASEPILIVAALLVVYVILGVLYESYIHPLTILSTLPSAGVGALLALWAGGFDLSVIGIIGIILLIGIVKKNGIMLVDFAITREREGLAPGGGDPRGLPVAVPPDHDDHDGDAAERPAADAGLRLRLRAAPAARLCHGGRAGAEPDADAVHHAGGLSLSRSPAGLAARRAASRAGPAAGCRGVIRRPCAAWPDFRAISRDATYSRGKNRLLHELIPIAGSHACRSSIPRSTSGPRTRRSGPGRPTWRAAPICPSR